MPRKHEHLQAQIVTARQREVLVLLVSEGLSRKQIARRLGICQNSVDMRFCRMYRRSGTPDETQLVLWALRRGLVSLGTVNGGVKPTGFLTATPPTVANRPTWSYAWDESGRRACIASWASLPSDSRL